MNVCKIMILSLIVLSIVPFANAHLIGGSGFASGAFHPLSGIDHLLAMIAVGIVATRHGRNAVWIIPATFVTSMVFGGIMGMSGIQISFVGAGIALSVIFLGMAIFLQRKFPLYLVTIFVALSAILHGHAHGSEMPLMASPILYAAGFVLSTSILHISGVLIGHYAKKTDFTVRLLRYAGALIGAAGIFFLLGV